MRSVTSQRIGLPARRLAKILSGLQHVRARPSTGPPAPVPPHAARVALEDLHAERRFHLRHLGAQRRLRHDERVGGAAESAEVRDRDEVMQLTQ